MMRKLWQSLEEGRVLQLDSGYCQTALQAGLFGAQLHGFPACRRLHKWEEKLLMDDLVHPGG